MNYYEAANYCNETYGTTVATIRNDNDAYELMDLMIEAGATDVWTGLVKVGNWSWAWSSGYPWFVSSF